MGASSGVLFCGEEGPVRKVAIGRRGVFEVGELRWEKQN